MAAPRTNSLNSFEPRLASLETSVASLMESTHAIAMTVDRIRGDIEAGNKPQWGNLIAAIGLSVVIISAIGASFITPLTVGIGYHEKMLVEQQRLLEVTMSRMRDNETAIESNGVVTKSEIASLSRDLAEVRTQGSGILRERLAIIESRLRLSDNLYGTGKGTGLDSQPVKP